MPEILDIIDLEDQVIGQATRDDIYAHKHMYRIVHIFVKDSAGRQLFQLRSPQSRYLPLHWSTAVGGHIHTGESYEAAAKREMAEEIGITDCPLREVGKFLYVSASGHKKYLSVFEAIIDDGFIPSEREIAELRFFTPEEAHELIMTGENIHPELRFLWEKLFYELKFQPLS